MTDIPTIAAGLTEKWLANPYAIHKRPPFRAQGPRLARPSGVRRVAALLRRLRMSEVVLMLAAIAIIMSAGWVYYLIVTAPWGWQDEDGFHEGKKDD